jgi:hypothetical protein
MIQDRNGNFLHSLLNVLRKTRKQDGSNAQDPSALESRRKLEQRIESALAEWTDSIQDHAA